MKEEKTVGESNNPAYNDCREWREEMENLRSSTSSESSRTSEVSSRMSEVYEGLSELSSRTSEVYEGYPRRPRYSPRCTKDIRRTAREREGAKCAFRKLENRAHSTSIFLFAHFILAEGAFRSTKRDSL